MSYFSITHYVTPLLGCAGKNVKFTLKTHEMIGTFNFTKILLISFSGPQRLHEALKPLKRVVGCIKVSFSWAVSSAILQLLCSPLSHSQFLDVA